MKSRFHQNHIGCSLLIGSMLVVSVGCSRIEPVEMITPTYPSVTYEEQTVSEVVIQIPTEPESTVIETTTHEEITTESPETTSEPESHSEPEGEEETTETEFDFDAVSASIEAYYPTDYASTESSYVGLSGKTANDYNQVLVRTMSEEDLILIDEVIEEIITKDMDRVAKIRAVHDWIILNVNYDWNFRAQTVHTALNDGLTVCNGYADTFYVFMTELGIPCGYYCGNSRGVYHMWNSVQLEDGYYYFIDVTWDDVTSVYENRKDKSDTILYDYFLKSRKVFDKDHEQTSKYKLTPEATKSVKITFETKESN